MAIADITILRIPSRLNTIICALFALFKIYGLYVQVFHRQKLAVSQIICQKFLTAITASCTPTTLT
jgi:hypothetical protein